MTTPARDPRTDPRPGDAPARDPRLDPRAGDVLAIHFAQTIVRDAHGSCVTFSPIGGIAQETTLEGWRGWAKDAEVIHRAED